MRRWQGIIFGSAMLGLGYLVGATGTGLNSKALAQEPAAGAADGKIRAVHVALGEAAEALKTDGKYEAITQGTNAFLVLAGGGNARADLDRGEGVDPETFAGLYAGRAIPEIQDQLTFDDQKRLTYNGKVIQMYSKTRLQQIFAERLRISGSK
jgi:hypothetical protein